jgi:hypothetical protein
MLFLLASSQAAAPASQPTTASTPEQLFKEHKSAERKEYEQKLADLPLAPQRRLSDFFELSIQNGELQIQPRAGKTERRRVQLQGFSGPALIAIGGEKANTPEGTLYVQFECMDFSAPDEVFRRVQLFASAASLQISSDVEATSGSSSVSLIQSYGTDEPENATRLYVQVFAAVTDDLQTKLNLSAPNFAALRHRYPFECRQYLDPMLRGLGQTQALLAPDAKLARQVFAYDAKPDANLAEKINTALAKFDDDDFKVRRSAAAALTELGEPAARVLSHADRTGWSVDRSNGVDAFLAQQQSKSGEELSQLGNDRGFLLDSLYSDDATVRAGAAARLKERTGQDISLDPAADLQARSAVVDRLYPRLFKPATRPTSQP